MEIGDASFIRRGHFTVLLPPRTRQQSGFCEKWLGGESLGTGLSLSSHNSDEEFLAKHLNVSTATVERWTCRVLFHIS